MMDDTTPEAGEPRALRITVVATCLMIAASACHQAYVAAGGRGFNAILSALLILATAGLWRRVRWGRRFAVAFLWALILVAFGAMSPFRAGDLLAEGIEPTPIAMLAAQFFIVCAVAVTCLHQLGRHKARFRAAWW